VVHDDVRKLIKYSMEDMLAASAAEGALDFWYNIVEPFFGLPPQKREVKVRSRPVFYHRQYLHHMLFSDHVEVLLDAKGSRACGGGGDLN